MAVFLTAPGPAEIIKDMETQAKRLFFSSLMMTKEPHSSSIPDVVSVVAAIRGRLLDLRQADRTELPSCFITELPSCFTLFSR